MHNRTLLSTILLITALFTTSLFAEPLEGDGKDFSVRLGGGYADFNDLGEILLFDFEQYEGDTYVLNFDTGWRFAENFADFPLDFYVKGGISYFNENNLQNNFFEATLYLKAYYKLDMLDNRIRIGMGEGLSWASHIPMVEIADAGDGDKTVAKFLNYLDLSVDFNLGHLVRVEALEEIYVGYTIKHRSGVAGLFSGVRGGSNYKMLTIEKNF